jgi:hypothetical protein
MPGRDERVYLDFPTKDGGRQRIPIKITRRLVDPYDKVLRLTCEVDTEAAAHAVAFADG